MIKFRDHQINTRQSFDRVKVKHRDYEAKIRELEARIREVEDASSSFNQIIVKPKRKRR